MNRPKSSIQEMSSHEILQFVAILGFVLVSFVVRYLLQVDLSLADIENGIYAEATYQAIDIGARKNLIWKLLFYGTIISFVFFLVYKYIRRFDIGNKSLNILSAVSFAGIMVHWVDLIGVRMPVVHELVLLSFVMVPLYCLLGSVIEKKGKVPKHNFFEFLVGVIAFTISTYFFIPEGWGMAMRFLFVGFFGMAASHLSILLLPKAEKQMGIFYGLLLFLPFVYFIYIEALVNHQTGGGKGGTIVWILVALLSFGYFYWLQTKNQIFRSKVWLGGMFVTGLTIIAYYAYAISYPDDQFEMANQANAMMRFFKFKEWPFIHYLSSHNLYDHLWPFLYTFINGYEQNVSYLSYDFARQVITPLMGFLLLTYLFRNWAIAALFICLFPFNRALFPMSLAILMIVPWVKTFEQLESKKILLLLSLSVAMILWRMDVGFGNLLACLALFVVYLFQFGDKSSFKKIIKPSLLFALGGAIVVVLVSVVFGFDTLRNHLSQALGYFSADQAHGLSNLAYDTGDRLFFIHYIAFPISIFILSVFLLLRFKKIYTSNPRILIALLYLIFFYFANFQRGLVRHSFLSGTDAFLSSFVFLIFGLAVTLLLKKQWQLIGFLIASTFLLHNFRLARTGGMHSTFEKVVLNLNTNPPYQIGKTKFVQGRMVDANKPYRGIHQFMDTHFSDEDTFLDFTNTPMLYFYTQRHLPSYFNQYLQNTVTRKLQQQNLKDLETKNVPVVIFQSRPLAWGDATDDVPNTLRYLSTAEHVYENYIFYKTIDGKDLWLKNNHPLLQSSQSKPHIDTKQFYDLKKLPSIKDGSDFREVSVELQKLALDSEIKGIGGDLNNEKSSLFEVPTNDLNYKNNYLKLDLASESKLGRIAVNFIFEDESRSMLVFEAKAGQDQGYEIPISWLYNFYKNFNNLSDLKIIVDADVPVKNISITQRFYE